MVMRLVPRKVDLSRICPVCRGHREMASSNLDLLMRKAQEIWGKRPDVFDEGHLLPEYLKEASPLEPVTMFRVRCPRCNGVGVESYIPKNTIRLEEPR
jgi:hypothetical protein